MSLQPMFSIMVQLHTLINYYSVPMGHEDSFADLGSFYCLWPYLILASLAEYGNSDVLCVVIDEADTCFELPTEKGQKWCDTLIQLLPM